MSFKGLSKTPMAQKATNPQAQVRARCYRLPNRLRVFKSYNYTLGFVACLK